MKTLQHLASRGLSLLVLTLLSACATTPVKVAHTVPVQKVAAVPKSVVKAPPVVAPDSGPWKVSPPVTTEAQLTDLFTQAIDRTVSIWEFTWMGARGEPLTNAVFRKASLNALQSSKRGGGYFDGYGWKWTQRSDSKAQQVSVNLNYRFPAASVASKVAEADQKAADVVATLITPSMSDYQKELALHDWLVANAQYDLANYNANTVPPPEYSPYGVLVLHTGVCESYATAFKLLAIKAGLESRIVTGKGDGADHAWNQLKVDGVWYNLDVTWDDPVGSEARVDHTYFNVDDNVLAARHEWDRATAQTCTSDAANWFVHEGLISNNLAEFSVQLRTVIQKRQTSIVRKIRVFDPKSIKSDVAAILQKVAVDSGTALRWTTWVEDSEGIVEVKYQY